MSEKRLKQASTVILRSTLYIFLISATYMPLSSYTTTIKDRNMESQQICKSDIVGTWKLIEFKITTKEGITRDWRPDSYGLLIYSNDGYMSVSINASATKEMLSNDLSNYILFYSGEFSISNKNVIKHNVTNATSPERIGKEMIRIGKIDEKGHLELSANGQYGHAQLLWEKAQ